MTRSPPSFKCAPSFNSLSGKATDDAASLDVGFRRELGDWGQVARQDLVDLGRYMPPALSIGRVTEQVRRLLLSGYIRSTRAFGDAGRVGRQRDGWL